MNPAFLFRAFLLSLAVVFFAHCSRNIIVSSFKYEKKWKGDVFQAGFAEYEIQDIPVGTYMAGYAPFRRSNARVLKSAPIHIKALYWQLGELDLDKEAGQGILFLSADFLGFTGDRVVGFKREISKRLKIPPGNILISATHNHSGPDTIGVWGGLSEEMQNQIRSAFLRVSLEAFQKRREVLAYSSQIDTKIPSVNRRKPQLALKPNQLSVLHFKNRNPPSPYVTAVFYSTHPVILGPKNQTPSGDFPGYFVRSAKNKFHHPFIFFNGALGDVHPPPIHEDVYDRQGGSEKDLEEFSQLLIKNIQKAFVSARPFLARELSIQTRDMKFSPEGQILLRLFNWFGWVGSARDQDGSLIAPVTRVSLGDHIHLLTVPGELFKIYEHQIKQKYPKKNIFFLGLCNDSLGYFMPREEINPKGGVAEIFLLNSSNGETWYKIADKLLSAP